MRHSRFLGALLAILALFGLMESQTVLAAHPNLSEFSMIQPHDTQGLEGAFQLAVMGGSTVPRDAALEKPVKVAPLETTPEKPVEVVQPAKPAVEIPKATPKKASKPKKKKVKKASVKKAPAKQPEEDGFLTNAFKKLVGSDDDKKEAASKSQIQKTSGKKSEPEKKEDGFLTNTLKSLVGGNEKEEKTDKKNSLNPINTVPISNAAKKKEEKQSKTAKSEAKKNLKDSFEKLIGVGAVKDKGDSKSAKTDKPAEDAKSAKKKESGGLLGGILGGGDKKKDSSATKQAKVKETVKKTTTPAKPRKLAAKKYAGEDEEGKEGESGGNYGGAKKGKNLLKESFKTLVTDDKK